MNIEENRTWDILIDMRMVCWKLDLNDYDKIGSQRTDDE
jgi:hypothetical protein